LVFVYIVFFFQAEDGIRDRNVTGVQTCALPISVRCADAGKFSGVNAHTRSAAFSSGGEYTGSGQSGNDCPDRRGGRRVRGDYEQIGRASCRERGESSGGGGAVSKENEEQGDRSR